jgi:hypothetical protein
MLETPLSPKIPSGICPPKTESTLAIIQGAGKLPRRGTDGQRFRVFNSQPFPDTLCRAALDQRLRKFVLQGEIGPRI